MYEIRIILVKDTVKDRDIEIKRYYILFKDIESEAIRTFENVRKVAKVISEILD
jgi:hypothetical protein